MPGVTTMNNVHHAQHDPTDGSRSLRPDSSHDDENVEMDDAEHEVDELSASKPKKKRRIIKTTDKKYECPQPDCGKSYSRAEHLYRHQLNHTPKQIYHCDFPGCDRHFVRADLCARHKERHTAKGSHLQRKDAFMNSQRAAATANPAPNGGAIPESHAPKIVPQTPAKTQQETQQQTGQAQQRQDSYMVQPSAQSVRSYQDPGAPYAPQPPLQAVSTTGSGDSQLDGRVDYNTYTTNYSNPGAMLPPPSPSAGERIYSTNDAQYARTNLSNGYATHQQLPMHPPPLTSPPTSNSVYSQQTYPPTSSNGSSVQSPTANGYAGMTPLSQYGMQTSYSGPGSARPGSGMSPPFGSLDQFQVTNSRAGGLADFNMMDQFSAGYAMPVFGGDGYNRSPQSALDDALFHQLLESGGMDLTNPPSPPPLDHIYNLQPPNMSVSKLEPGSQTPTDTTSNPPAWDTSSPETNGMDLSMRESIVTERKQGRLIELIRGFEDAGDSPHRRRKADILAGDTSDPNHPMSVNMFKTYLTSYWIHIHQQMPIMHRPTFNAETCPDLLLLAMTCLGACCLERTHTPEVIKDCSELAFFAAYHIRWEVFKDVEFRPTAKLWTFQTMLLLELFEKMYSTRPLHERAHIHHATTLTVMRRGSSLIGRSNLTESPSGPLTDPTRTPPGPDGSINTSGQNTADAFWNRWITAEATRRVAFAAFIIDSTHATLFGHSAVMAPHDLRLPLPCDEALWAATSSAEVQRVEASLAANGFKPVSFLEGLKKTLNGQKVRTNIFGRVILMAGLLNVSWHMNQRDLQVSSLGANQTLGNHIRWRSPLTRAFDFWRRDFDESLSKSDHYLQVSGPENKSKCHNDHRDNVFESKTCLHSLAHMAMHVDIVDCEVFAGAERALGRIVTEADRVAVQRRMREQWAPSARARDATFYALKFLCEVLIPEDDLAKSRTSGTPVFTYNARDDYLLNRPWILYFAVMIVWSYGYALEGAIQPAKYTLTTPELQIYDLQRYLLRVGAAGSPEELEALKDRNSCLGLLVVLRDCFRQPRWELLHEAADMLQLCIELLVPGNVEVKTG